MMQRWIPDLLAYVGIAIALSVLTVEVRLESVRSDTWAKEVSLLEDARGLPSVSPRPERPLSELNTRLETQDAVILLATVAATRRIRIDAISIAPAPNNLTQISVEAIGPYALTKSWLGDLKHEAPSLALSLLSMRRVDDGASVVIHAGFVLPARS